MRKIQWAILFALVVKALTSNAQTAVITSQGPQLNRLVFFAEEKPLQMTIATNFKKLLGQRKKGVFQPATATVYLSEADSTTETINISTRGIFRLKQCNMPGLMLNFKNGAELSKLSSLKKIENGLWLQSG